MEPVVFIEFGKSRSANYKKAVALADELPNNDESEGRHTVCINTVREYIIAQEGIHKLIQIIHRWKGVIINFYGEPYTSEWDYQSFMRKVSKSAGKYSVLLKNREQVSLGAVTVEKLPLPFVWYPGLYGTFFCFSEDVDKPVYFCSCEKKSIENYFKLKRLKNSVIEENNLLGFPDIIKIEAKAKAWGNDIENHLRYKDHICFKCNKQIPKKIYCHPMYGGKFRQHYGWYINQEYYKMGIDKSLVGSVEVLPDECSPEIYDSVLRIKRLIGVNNGLIENYKEIEQVRNELDKAIENSVRKQLGFRKIGDAWVSETMLFGIVQGLYPEKKIERHYRPNWLEGLELDIYIPELKIAFEYQGIQHFKPVEHWGGKKQLEKQKEHDKRKKQICEDQEIKLICVNYDEPLTVEHITHRIMGI